MRLTIEIEPGSNPISGWISGPGDAPPRRFAGWIELAGRIEAARTADPIPPPPDPLSRPPFDHLWEEPPDHDRSDHP